jgi:hypothetical protein
VRSIGIDRSERKRTIDAILGAQARYNGLADAALLSTNEVNRAHGDTLYSISWKSAAIP